MHERGITRRSLLAAGAGTLAAGLVRRADALAALAPRASLDARAAPRLFWRSVGRLPAGERAVTVDLGANADLLGVSFHGDAKARVQLRARSPAGGWSAWASAGDNGHAPDGGAPTSAITGDPVWTGGSAIVQLRADQALSGVRIACVDVSDGRGAHALAVKAGPTGLAAALALASPTLAAGPGQPPILARRVWAQGIAEPRVAPEYGVVRMAFVHHTENPNGYSAAEVPAMLRAIFVFHRYVHGWNDIGYNFVIDLYGRIFEARAGGIDEPVVGAQAGGYNAVSTGVAVLGDFISSSISPAAAQALQRLLAWKLALHGTPPLGRVTVRVTAAGAGYSRFPAGAHVSLPRVAGHRDADSTDCPGDALYAELPALRPRVQALAGRIALSTIGLVAQISPAGGQATPSPGQPTAGTQVPPAQGSTGQTGAGGGGATGPATLVLAGRLAFLGGAPIPGAPVLIQVRAVAQRGQLVSEQTIARATTDSGGEWSVQLASAAGRGETWLRALCPGGSEGGPGGLGATLSESLRVSGMVTGAQAPAPTS